MPHLKVARILNSTAPHVNSILEFFLLSLQQPSTPKTKALSTQQGPQLKPLSRLTNLDIVNIETTA